MPRDSAGKLVFNLVMNGGFVEATAMRTLPVLAPVVLFGVVKWTEAGQCARQEAGLNKSILLMPAPVLNEGWSKRSLTSAEIGRWLCSLLSSEGLLNSEANVGSHSCKCTVLSWLAKLGVDPSIRKFLGYHSTPGDKSMLAYSRDAAAGP